MSKVLGADQSNYRNFAAEYEIPVERRQVLRVSEETTRGTGVANTDLSRPLRFIWTNPNPMTVVRSAFYRLPMKITFKDQRDLPPSSRSAAKMALRNRQSKIFRDQRIIMNGMQFHHDAELDGIEEFTHKWSGPGAFQLENRGLPVSTVREYENTMDQTTFNALTVQTLGSCSVPVTQTQVSTHVPGDNENFTERSKMFRADYTQSTGVWEGEVCVPLQGGVFQPYQSKKSGGANKYIPFISTLHVEANFETGGGRSDPPATNADHYAVAQGMFERSSNVADACRDTYEAGPEYELRPYTLVANANMAWIILELDTDRQNVGANIMDRDQARTLETATELSAGAAARMQKILEVFKPGTGIRFSPELHEYSHITAATVARRAVIGNVTSFASFAGQFSAFSREELKLACFGGTIISAINAQGAITQAVQVKRFNPIEYTTTGTLREISDAVTNQGGTRIDLFARGASSIEGMNGQHQGAVGDAVHGNTFPAFANNKTFQNLRKGQLSCLRNPAIGVSLSGFALTAAEFTLCRNNGNAARKNQLAYPLVRYFVESRDGVPIHWSVPYEEAGAGGLGGAGATDAYHQVKTILAASAMNATTVTFGGNGAQDIIQRGLINEYLMTHGFHYRLNVHGFPALAGDHEHPYYTDQLAHRINAGGTAIGNVNYTFEDMIHVGVNQPFATGQLGINELPPHFPLLGDAILTAKQAKVDGVLVPGRGVPITGRYKFRLYPTRYDTASDNFHPEEYTHSVREGIGSVTCEFTGQPVLELELIDFSRAVKMSPVQQLWCPQKEIYYQADLAQGAGGGAGGNSIQFTRANEVDDEKTNETVILMNNIRLNEVFNTITINGRLAERSKCRFEYVEYLKPYIKSIEIGIAENPKLTTQYSSQLLYRMFKENTLSDMTYNDWRNNCIICLSPQQLALPNFSESLSIVSAINLKITVEPSPIARNLLLNWDHMNYTGTSGTVLHNQGVDNNDVAIAPSEPYYEMRVHFDYDNHSLLMNSRREILLKKNARVFKGNSGLELVRKGLPEQRGLKLY